MARQPEIRYIRYYTDGSAARQQEFHLPKKKRRSALPKPRKQEQKLVYVDPLAWGGIAISVVMLVLMIVGFVQLYSLQKANAYMESYVHKLEQKNAELSDTYRENIDLEQIEEFALALGMIPQEQAQTVTIRIPPLEQTPEPSIWERFTTFLAGLFA